ncbi:hypothetical protein, partial [Candidatus Enterovibrio escicola]|uniref:hypothetical protein n=1 Tax=Candidatus Enterovibrio escicola TaxID=1927127 RepID=UPI001CC2F0E6
LINCPACSTGKLKLTKQEDKFYCSNAFEKGRRQCKTFINRMLDGQPDIIGWSNEKSGHNEQLNNREQHRCPICNTLLRREIAQKMYICSNSHSFQICNDGSPNTQELSGLQKHRYI